LLKLDKIGYNRIEGIIRGDAFKMTAVEKAIGILKKNG